MGLNVNFLIYFYFILAKIRVSFFISNEIYFVLSFTCHYIKHGNVKEATGSLGIDNHSVEADKYRVSLLLFIVCVFLWINYFHFGENKSVFSSNSDMWNRVLFYIISYWCNIGIYFAIISYWCKLSFCIMVCKKNYIKIPSSVMSFNQFCSNLRAFQDEIHSGIELS